MAAAEMVVERRAYARVGLLGNPSDVYGGRALSFTIANFSATVRLRPSPELLIQPHPHHGLVAFPSLSTLIDDAVKVYEEKEPFGFIHCWRTLREEPKWNDRVLELNNIATSVQGQGNDTTIQGEKGSDNGVPERPEGRDKVKKSRSIMERRGFEPSSDN